MRVRVFVIYGVRYGLGLGEHSTVGGTYEV